MNSDAMITEGIVEILERHTFRILASRLVCDCGVESPTLADHQYHIAERLSANIDYWFGLKRFHR